MKDKSKNTEYLNNKLLESHSIKTFLKSHKEINELDNFGLTLSQLIVSKEKTNSETFKLAQISESTGYQILSGRRLPSRDKVLQLAIALSLNLKETNQLLRMSKRGELYVKDKRDAIIIFSLNHTKTLLETNDILYEENCTIFE